MEVRRGRVLATIACTFAITMTPLAAPVLAAEPVELVFASTGAEQTFVVPDGVTSLHVDLVGGRGGVGATGGIPGDPERVIGDIDVIPGTTLFLEVGGDGGPGAPDASHRDAGGVGGFNGGGTGGRGFADLPGLGGSVGFPGGGGGGASDIRTTARDEAGSLDTRLIVAAGGGGSGGGGGAGPGGNAGSAGGGAAGGGAATADAGGAGGPGGNGGDSGLAGELGGGGAGGRGLWAGGGAGAGLFGGGGGGGNDNGSSGGGAGGASFTGEAADADVSVAADASPSITISYADTTPDTGVVDAEVTVPTSAACVELSTTSVSFGTQRFGSVAVQASPDITITNCSAEDEALLARGTSAASNGATWTLVDTAGTCDAGTLGTDEFHLKLRRPADEVDPVTQLGSDNKEVAELTGGDAITLEALLDMPCPGSEGAGQTMGMNIVFVVTELE